MKKIIFLTLAPLLFFGCAQFQTSQVENEVDQNSFEEKKKSLDLVVERNKDCEKYRDILEEKIEFYEVIGDIFYSPKADSCLAVYDGGMSNWRTISLDDVLSEEIIASVEYHVEPDDISQDYVVEQANKLNEFDRIVADYKN